MIAEITAMAATQPLAAMLMPGPRPLTPGEALEMLFMDNADRGANAANDELVAALRPGPGGIQALADMTTPPPPLPETTRSTRPRPTAGRVAFPDACSRQSAGPPKEIS